MRAAPRLPVRAPSHGEELRCCRTCFCRFPFFTNNIQCKFDKYGRSHWISPSQRTALCSGSRRVPGMSGSRCASASPHASARTRSGRTHSCREKVRFPNRSRGRNLNAGAPIIPHSGCFKFERARARGPAWELEHISLLEKPETRTRRLRLRLGWDRRQIA